ncbi:MAG TPA: DUF86 domain-containing protein [Spirochaetota bacterium]|nr:DUF86 domain-containing protein [Spirochaetota bacterium]
MKYKKYLMDILTVINEIEMLLEGTEKLEDYKNNLILKRAIERCLEIIGEAMNNLLNINPSINISDTRKIISMRNRIIHGYDKVDDDLLWKVVKGNIPTLKEEVTKLLEE